MIDDVQRSKYYVKRSSCKVLEARRGRLLRSLPGA